MKGLREALEGAYARTDEVDADTDVHEENHDIEDNGNDIDDTGVDTNDDVTAVENPDDTEDQETKVTTKSKKVETDETLEDGEPTDAKLADSDVKTEKPPVGWTPKNREHWGKLPAELKEQISKREREVNQVLQQSSTARKLEQAFTQVVEPYRAIMASQGVDNPLQAIDGLMKTAATLSMGNKQQKAQRIAELINHYGVDIETLDGALVGAAPKQQPQDIQSQIDAAVSRSLQPLMQERQSQQNYQRQQLQNVVQQKIQAIESREFFNDLRHDMADIMEMASKRGQAVSLEQAYDRAAQLNPEIANVLKAREQTNSLRTKQRAATSVSGNRGGMISGTANASMAEILNHAWNGDI